MIGTHFSDRNLLSLVLRCKDIEVLHLGCTAITRVGVYIIIKHLPKLTHLALSIDALKFKELSTMQNLKYLWNARAHRRMSNLILERIARDFNKYIPRELVHYHKGLIMPPVLLQRKQEEGIQGNRSIKGCK